MHTAPTKIRHYAEGGLIAKIFGKSQTPAPSSTGSAPPVTAATVPLGSGGADQARTAIKSRSQRLADMERSAVGMAKGGKVRSCATGGKIPGKSPSATADNIPIMATAGEYMIKKKAVDHIGVQVLDALNAIADKPGVAKQPTKKKAGPLRKMAGGGYLYNEYRAPADEMRSGGGASQTTRPVAQVAQPSTALATTPQPQPYKPNFTMGGQPPAGPPPQIGTSVPRPTAVAAQPYTPNFTMGGQPAQPPASSGAATDVRAKYNPANGSPEAKAWQASRAAAPAAAPAAPGPMSRMAAAAGRAGQAVASSRPAQMLGKVAAPAVLAGAAGAVLADQTRDVGNPANQPAGTATVDPRVADLVSRIPTGGVPGAGPTPATQPFNAYTDTEAGRNIGNLASAAGAVPGVGAVTRMAAPVVKALGVAQGFGAGVRAGRDQTAPAPAAPAAAAPATQPVAAATPVANPADPQAATGQVMRDGSSYSGTNVAGNVNFVNRKGEAVSARGGFVGNVGDAAPVRLGPDPSIGQALSDARDQAQARGDWDAVARSYGGDFGPKVDPVDALMNNGRPMTARKASALAALKQSVLQEANAKANKDKAEQETAGIQLDNQGKRKLAKLQDALTNAKTAAERLTAEDNLRAFQGKYEKTPPPVRAFAVPGGQQVTEQGQVYQTPSRVYDPDTKQFIDPNQGPALPPGMVRQVGTSNGRPVYVDKNGKHVIAKAQ